MGMVEAISSPCNVAGAKLASRGRSPLASGPLNKAGVAELADALDSKSEVTLLEAEAPDELARTLATKSDHFRPS